MRKKKQEMGKLGLREGEYLSKNHLVPNSGPFGWSQSEWQRSTQVKEERKRDSKKRNGVRTRKKEKKKQTKREKE